MSRAAVQALVDDLVRDTDGVIASGTRDTAIDTALDRYSVDAPRRVIEDVAADGVGNLALPSAWIDGASSVEAAEWPIGERPQAFLPAHYIGVIETPSGSVIAVQADIPEDALVRLTYTTAHTLSVSVDTVPARHRYALAALAASILCGQLAAHYANEGAPTIGADVADHQGKTERWRARQRDLEKQYVSIVGVSPADRSRPASVDVAVERNDSLGRRRMFHPPGSWPR